MKQQSRLKLLMSAVNRWLEQPKASRAIICGEIVQAANDCGLSEILKNEGITFNQSDDLYNDLRVNAQKIFRWLGQYDGIHAFLDRLWCLEPAIVAAMPEALRLSYLNDVFGVTGVVVCSRQVSCEHIDATRMAACLTKEQMEAQVSVIELGIHPDLESARRAYQEVSEAVATGAAVLGELERTYPELNYKGAAMAARSHAVIN
ncbi:hypothetical protein [Hahella sp. HN01]|uniref:hypothetical protein n=1 Tax=Hahella sp. HN01 TaxID=2847262 RepID=UPI001C1F0C47|nr:hypothetical protein [Hahella sp. HN01]MBU6956072.1 hypothetical protein [Hahella sp. HN01]